MPRSAMIACLAVTAGLAACVLVAPASAGLYLSKISFVDASYGWASCTSADGLMSYCVARTTDGGATWTRQKSTQAFNGTGWDVQFVSRSRGIWVNSYVYRTTDGGAHWRRVSFTGQWGGGTLVDFAGPSVVWLAGTGGSDGMGRYVARSTNGGGRWRTQLAQPKVWGGWPTALCAPTTSTAYMWSSGLWATHNGGTTWARVRSSHSFKRSAQWLLSFPTAKTGWALRYNTNVLLRTKDGGKHWTPQMKGLQQRFYAQDFVNGRTGWVTGAAGAVYRTRDGGATWSYQQTPTSADLISVDFVDSLHGWVAATADWGEDNPLFRTADGGETWEQVR